MAFNTDPSKEAQDKIFSWRCANKHHPCMYFNNIPVTQTANQKHIGLCIEVKLNYNTQRFN